MDFRYVTVKKEFSWENLEKIKNAGFLQRKFDIWTMRSVVLHFAILLYSIENPFFARQLL